MKINAKIAALATGLMLFSVFPRLAAAEDVSVEATVSEPVVGLNNIFNYIVKVVTPRGVDVDDVHTPKFGEYFETIGQNQSSSTQISIVGGNMSSSTTTTYFYTLRATRLGRFRFSPATVVVSGKEYQSDKVEIEVHKTAPGNRQQRRRRSSIFDDPFSQDPFEEFFGRKEAPRGDVMVKLILDRNEVYVGQPVVASIYLMTRESVSGVSDIRPQFKDFWGERADIPNPPRAERRKIGGRIYQSFLLFRSVLFPLKTGELTIDAVPVTVQVSTGGFFGRAKEFNRSTEPVTVNVKPLPEENKPLQFDTAHVGRFSLTAQLDRNRVSAGKPVTLTLTIAGEGNLRNIDLPKLPQSKDYRTYPPSVTENLAIKGGKFQGEKSVEYLIVPMKAGVVAIPRMYFNYFDPETSEYGTLSTPDLSITVTEGEAAGPAEVEENPPEELAQNGKPVIHERDFEPIRFPGKLKTETKPISRRPWFVFLLLAAPLAFVLVISAEKLAGALKRKSPGALRREEEKKLRRRLDDAQGLLQSDDPVLFYGEIEKILEDALSLHLDESARGMTRKELNEKLEQAGFDEGFISSVGEIFDSCGRVRFAPGGADKKEMSGLLTELKNIVNDLDGKAPRKRAA